MRGCNLTPTLERVKVIPLIGGNGRLACGATVYCSAQILLRAAVAAVLNAADPNVAYPLTEAQIIEEVNAVLASGSRTAMIVLATTLDNYNNYPCPLN